MAVNKFNEYDKKTHGFDMPLNMHRATAYPLDNSALWTSLDAAKAYAKDSVIAYIGQILTVVENDTVTVWKIADTAGTLVQIDAEVADPTLNLNGSAGISEVNDDIVTLKAGVVQTNGAISNSDAADITLAKVAKTGTAADVAVVDADNKLDATNVEAALTELVGKIDDKTVTIEKTEGTGTTEYAAKYIVKQGGTEVGSVEIGKDLVATNGEMVYPTEEAPIYIDNVKITSGSYIKMTINFDDPFYIDVADLVELTKVKSTTEIELTNIDNTIEAKVGRVGADKIDWTTGEGESATVVTVQAALTEHEDRITTLETATTLQDAKDYVDGKIAALDVTDTALATVADDVVTIKAIKEVDGKIEVSADSSKDVTLAKVATTGTAADVSISDGLKSAIGSDSATVDSALTKLDTIIDEVAAIAEKLDNTEETDGSVRKLIKDAKDALIGTKDDAKEADTIYGAKAYAEDKLNIALEGANSALIGEESDLPAANTIWGAKNYAKGLVEAEAKTRGDADTAILNKIGNVDEGKTVVAMIGDAKTAAENTAAGALATARTEITAEIGKAITDANLGQYATVDALNKEIQDRTDADTAILNKIGEVTEGKTVVELIDEAKQGAIENAKVTLNKGTGIVVDPDGEASTAFKISVDVETIATKTYVGEEIAKLTAEGGDVKALQDAVGTLNGDENTEGSVAKAVKDAVAAEAKTREDDDKALGERIDTLDAEGTGRVSILEGQVKNITETTIPAIQKSVTDGVAEAKKHTTDLIGTLPEGATTVGEAITAAINAIPEVPEGTTAQKGIVQLTDTVTATDSTMAVTGKAISTLAKELTQLDVNGGTYTIEGIAQLLNNVVKLLGAKEYTEQAQS